jgi:hypothetical protein
LWLWPLNGVGANVSGYGLQAPAGDAADAVVVEKIGECPEYAIHFVGETAVVDVAGGAVAIQMKHGRSYLVESLAEQLLVWQRRQQQQLFVWNGYDVCG